MLKRKGVYQELSLKIWTHIIMYMNPHHHVHKIKSTNIYWALAIYLCWYVITYNTYHILLILRHTLVHILTPLKPTCSLQLMVCGRLIVIAFVVIIDISLAYYETYFLFTLCRAVGWLWLHWPLLWSVWLGLAYLCTATYVVLESRWKD